MALSLPEQLKQGALRVFGTPGQPDTSELVIVRIPSRLTGSLKHRQEVAGTAIVDLIAKVAEPYLLKPVENAFNELRERSGEFSPFLNNGKNSQPLSLKENVRMDACEDYLTVWDDWQIGLRHRTDQQTVEGASYATFFRSLDTASKLAQEFRGHIERNIKDLFEKVHSPGGQEYHRPFLRFVRAHLVLSALLRRPAPVAEVIVSQERT